MRDNRNNFRVTKILRLVLGSLFGVMVISACSPTGGAVPPTGVPSATPRPTVVKSLPTPVSPGMEVVYGDLRVAMSQAEITTSYLTEYGSTREPPVGMEFLWVHISLTDIGQGPQDLPAPEHFSAINGETEFKPTYGHRRDHTDYLDLTTGLVQGQSVDAWLRFDIPAALELKDLTFAFLPESSQISVGFSSSNYPTGDHPIYIWMCAP